MIITHLQHISQKYPKDKFIAGCHRVVEIDGKEIEIVLDEAKWTRVMDGQWEILPAEPIVCAIKNTNTFIQVPIVNSI